MLPNLLSPLTLVTVVLRQSRSVFGISEFEDDEQDSTADIDEVKEYMYLKCGFAAAEKTFQILKRWQENTQKFLVFFLF